MQELNPLLPMGLELYYGKLIWGNDALRLVERKKIIVLDY
jgi:hypothetical protein